MKVSIAPRSAEVIREVDVLVVGGGPAGIGAAVSAAGLGKKVLLLEKNGFLGGNITKSFVETCNHFLKNTHLSVSGVWARLEKGYREVYGNSHDTRPNAAHRFSSEYLRIYLDKFVTGAGAEVLFHSFVNDVVVKDGKVQAVIIQTKQGPQAVSAKMVVDCTGDGDVFYAAGLDFEQGRDTDHLCQPGTLSFRVNGVDAKFLVEGGVDKLSIIGKRFHEDYRAGKTGLKCIRQDLPFGRLTAGGMVSYVNYPCAYKIDPTSIQDLSRGEMECREYIDEMMGYMRGHFEGFQNAELCGIGTEICFRDSRRVKGRYKLTIEDMDGGREFEDVIAVYPAFYDMLAPDANMDGDGSWQGRGYNGHIFTPVVNDKTFQIPFGSLVPLGVDNLLVGGRCICSDHVAQSGIRAISACMQTGEAAGAAAAIAVDGGTAAGDVDVAELQGRLKAQGVELPC